ncbi:MAG: RNA polymerase sigma factor, partial [Alphaproteobacteria bacterium]|nr:RNA polymerase sigma factor [Alphaproteobacteria bacterium]
MNQPAEDELILKAINGDRHAFDALVSTHYGMMYRLAFRWCGNKSDAEDITQNAFIKTAENLWRFRFESSLKTWLYRITLN